MELALGSTPTCSAIKEDQHANSAENGNGEILGGLWVLLVSLAALRAVGLPRGLNILGLLVGAVGIISLIPGLTELLIGVFGLGQVIWFIWPGIIFLRSNSSTVAQQTNAFALRQRTTNV